MRSCRMLSVRRRDLGDAPPRDEPNWLAPASVRRLRGESEPAAAFGEGAGPSLPPLRANMASSGLVDVCPSGTGLEPLLAADLADALPRLARDSAISGLAVEPANRGLLLDTPPWGVAEWPWPVASKRWDARLLVEPTDVAEGRRGFAEERRFVGWYLSARWLRSRSSCDCSP